MLVMKVAMLCMLASGERLVGYHASKAECEATRVAINRVQKVPQPCRCAEVRIEYPKQEER